MYVHDKADYSDSKACTSYSVGNVQMNIHSLCKLMSLGAIDFINIPFTFTGYIEQKPSVLRASYWYWKFG